ncbi:hypothetical protein B0H14DRAFT_3903864 [Mycena olivaceomarginata]|nr:hypothetical protein B0H14DRAFT_3903864 [Mycena olivaceomarginata]
MPAAATYPSLIGKSFVAPLVAGDLATASQSDLESSDPGVFSERSQYNVDDMPGIRSASSVGPAQPAAPNSFPASTEVESTGRITVLGVNHVVASLGPEIERQAGVDENGAKIDLN